MVISLTLEADPKVGPSGQLLVVQLDDERLTHWSIDVLA